ncbi:hypothetical protein SASPL_111902 [Salvia splendens]|uniref:Uncharacterized protein n=1 Tax=Salvia splendens TaxID=180675 RepID=A0A8X8Y7R2_SALSN|nr:hypothetical protein SASPL_111902 [Salvia splendens]
MDSRVSHRKRSHRNCALRRRCPEEVPVGNYEEKQVADAHPPHRISCILPHPLRRCCCRSRPIYTFYIGKAQFEIEKTSAGGLRVKVTEEMIVRRHREMEAEAEMARQIARVCTTPQLKKENETLVGWRRQWKPKLDTVYEKKGRRPRKILRKTKSNVV